MEKLRIIVGGYIGLYPTGGATWDYIQYPLGLKMLGHDVYYIEDTMQYPVFQKSRTDWNDASASVNYLKNVMEFFGLGNKWAYRDIASGKSFGLTDEEILKVCSTADIFINISCSTYMRDEYAKIPVRVLIDSDPMFTQIQYAIEMKQASESKNWNTKLLLETHNYLFTFGENIGKKDCKIPELNFKWHTTRQPVCLNHWQDNRSVNGNAFTTVMNWSGRKQLLYKNEKWGQKDIEFNKFKTVPSEISEEKFEVVINIPENKQMYFRSEEYEVFGWKILKPDPIVSTISGYQEFIKKSFAEFSVAKETYVKSKSGWFSCRSACYLASGKPVITQDTGWTNFIPSGKGLFAFSDINEIKDAAKQIRSDLKLHSEGALEIANDFFDSNKVLTDLLSKLT
jgi:hypothetical protein